MAPTVPAAYFVERKRLALEHAHILPDEGLCRLYYALVHCNKVSKPVKGNYLLLCMNSIMYLLLT